MRDWLHEYEHTHTLVLVLTSVMVVMDEALVTMGMPFWVVTLRVCWLVLMSGEVTH